MKKVFIILISSVVLIASVFAGCSQKDTETGAVTSEAVTQNESVQSSTEESTSESGTTTTIKTEDKTSTTAKSNSSTTKSSGNKTTTKAQNQSAAKTTAKATNKTTAKATTKATTKSTTKATTKKQTTTVKNVSARDVQNQVNSYIRSRGITVDSSLNSGNSGWSGRISATRQDSLNDGTSLRNCKSYVDSEISSMGTDISLYCYYDGTYFYICYM